MAEYAHPEVLVNVQWVADNLQNPKVRLIEADEDVLLYDIGHIPGAVKLDWNVDVQNPLSRDFIDKEGFEKLLSKWGITNDTTIVLYGDKNNWYATYAFWLFKLYGHKDLRILNGGRAAWEAAGQPYTKDVPTYQETNYQAQPANEGIRAFRDQIFERLGDPGLALVDVRSPQEYSGELLHMVNYPQEGAQRAGHIPGAKNIPWATGAREDGTFKSADELRKLYEEKGITPDKDVITYCRIGERAAYSWFILTQLLGYQNVRNYDGSWTEWGSLVRSPIER
ncbi:thiosulfate/3-mercaptopyruvate sulfurtransferase [Thermosporothrix hazakensis]|jgi:thiosulfate/3-mercaptopyruvate sulfurtransferase|uniref:Sulfurtransferase n=2 Tax=Thermosporothrix TaxID=768650 RepID=A0A326UJQ5_THEHA|nr:sulfurtransferase [Thermosporothrix hazakensis]PZW36850.1 thiosulfate/3-mercaptopyruvate sulfurtransferase [Thermosporothrix hazakensis]BBH89316.1 sulfurtransferase [Thermosporothrix sp. COM3]GCE47498.1 sulfurtransferase [Thermosporothrix hazakensis]